MYKGFFDQVIDRTGTAAGKTDSRKEVFGRADVIPMWVADMDLPTAPEITAALVARASHPIYGYTDTNDDDLAAIHSWLKERFDLDIKPEWILWGANVVSSLRICVNALTQPGDTVVINTPVYGPFFASVRDSGRTLRESPLLNTPDGWRIDFADMEAAFKDGAKALIICNPHNPVGRVWTRDELLRIAELARKYNVLVISDEIHSGFIFKPHKFTSMMSLLPESISLISATKNFNLAGLGISNMIVQSEERRNAIRKLMTAYGISDGSNNVFGTVAQRVAYGKCSQWQRELCDYIEANCRRAVEYMSANMPCLKPYMPEGTYLMWLDTTTLGDSDTVFKAFCDAGVGLSAGTFFGDKNRLRLNVACPRSQLDAALECMKNAVDSLMH